MTNVPYINLEYVYSRIYSFFAGGPGGLLGTLKTIGFVIWVICLVLLPILILGIIYLVRRLGALEAFMAAEVVESNLETAPLTEKEDKRWGAIVARLNSTNEADWKLAIIEADSMLDDLIASVYPHKGNNLGERLKNVEVGDFTHLQEAWAAHKVRNQIAHDHEYVLTDRTARIALDQYRQVFEEFHYI